MAEPSKDTVFVAVFATGARLDAVERFVCSLPTLFPSALAACDLGWRSGANVVAVVMRFQQASFDEQARTRLEFWCGRAGVRCSELDQLPDPQRGAFFTNFEKCERKVTGILPGALTAECIAFFTAVGAPAVRTPPDGRPVLGMDVGGPGWAGVRYDVGTRTLFLPGQLAPPRGDALVLAIRFPGPDRPLESQARVLGKPDSGVVGFTVELVNPPSDLVQALEARAVATAERKGAEMRVHQRYTVKAPVMVAMPGEGEEPVASVAAPADLLADLPTEPFPVARVEYGSEKELAADFVENLSQGGAFVRTPRPSPVGTRLVLSMRLPTGEELTGPAVVMTVKPNGMGVKFDFPSEAQQTLAAALAHIAQRPRRALVVDDEELVRRMLQDALQRRGFEVLTASDGATGLSIVVEELLALDLLVTDLRMPNMDGYSFIRTIRNAGGEADLAIVVVTAGVESALEKRLQREGADAVLDKELGPELIAQAADAVLERKRTKGS
jgi:CheY-like chemotaxis protein